MSNTLKYSAREYFPSRCKVCMISPVQTVLVAADTARQTSGVGKLAEGWRHPLWFQQQAWLSQSKVGAKPSQTVMRRLNCHHSMTAQKNQTTGKRQQGDGGSDFSAGGAQIDLHLVSSGWNRQR